MSDEHLNIEIHSASAGQAPEIHRFLQSFIASDQLLARTEDDIRNLIPRGFVATCESRIVGFAAVEVYSRKLAELQCLAVDSGVQGNGVGQRLVEMCVAEARKDGVLELMAITANEKIFRRCGFEYSLPFQKRALFIATGSNESN